MPRASRTRTVTANEVRRYLAKAEEFLVVAEECLEAGRLIAATGNAVHAGINAADAVCGARTRQRSTAQCHEQSLSLLKQAGDDGKELAKHLSRRNGTDRGNSRPGCSSLLYHRRLLQGGPDATWGVAVGWAACGHALVV